MNTIGTNKNNKLKKITEKPESSKEITLESGTSNKNISRSKTVNPLMKNIPLPLSIIFLARDSKESFSYLFKDWSSNVIITVNKKIENIPKNGSRSEKNGVKYNTKALARNK